MRANPIANATIVILIPDLDVETTYKIHAEVTKDETKPMTQIFRTTEPVKVQKFKPFTTYIDLHTTRNLQLHSSSICSYNIMSNAGSDNTGKNMPVRANYAEIIVDRVNASFDYLYISRRSLNRLGFHLTDAYSKIIKLNNNHWYFSIVFSENGTSIISNKN
jgi:hypothetical protein